MNGMIIVIFIILYFAFRFLKAKDSQDSSGRYSKRPYDTGYQWNRGVPPKDDVPESNKDEGEYGDKTYGAEGKSETYEAGPYGFEAKEDIGEGKAEVTEHVEKAAEVKPLEVNTDYKMPEVPAPETIGLKMPEPMSMPEMSIVIDSEVYVDTAMSPDKEKS